MISSYKLFKVYERKIELLSACYNLNLGNVVLVCFYGEFWHFWHPFLCKSSMSYECSIDELTCIGEDKK